MPYNPETTVIQGLARVIRERRLPPQAIPRMSQMLVGAHIEAVTQVLEGDVLRDYRIIDVADYFNLPRATADQVAELIETREGQRVQFGGILARRSRGRRTRTLISPVDGLVIKVENGRIYIQVNERVLEVMAKIPADVEEVESHRVRLIGQGAVLQCAWGNGKFNYSVYKYLPDEGFVGLSKLDPRISEYRNVALISTQPINKGDLLVAQQHEASAVVAPAMPSDLREFAMGLTFPVLLTEGFGQRRPTALIYRLLADNIGRQASFDAAVPDRWSWERPEIVIPLPAGGLPPTPTLDQALTVGAMVRITRAPWEGVVGQVVEIPTTPQVVDSGLRVPSAKIRLSNERVGLVPLANLELLG
ncbi:MAG: hypothetical protein HY866_02100 [Chloroflexi bacterium]|nr:hypothetical protein [Chloroflexota bacterium]